MDKLTPILASVALAALAAFTLAQSGTPADDPAGPRAIATAQAVTAAADLARLAHDRAVTQEAALSWLWFGAQSAMIVAGALCAVALMWAGARHAGRRMMLTESRLELLASVAETRSGTVSPRLDLRPLTPAIVDLAAPTDASAADDPAPAETFLLHGPRGAVLLTKHPEDRPADVRLALRVLRLSMQRHGAQAQRLAGWRELNLSADVWQRAIEALRPYITTRAGRGGGTFTRDGMTLHTLYADLSRGAITLARREG